MGYDIFVLFAVLYISLVPCYGLPPARSSGQTNVLSLNPNTSIHSYPPLVDIPALNNTSTHNSLSLAQNVARLQIHLSRQDDIRFRQSELVSVELEGPYAHFSTTNLNDLRRARTIFKSGQPDPQHPQKTEFEVKNDPIHWTRWRWDTDAIVWFYDDRFWDGADEIQWEEIQAVMDIHEADRLVKAAGWTQPFHHVTVGKMNRVPRPRWCFSYLEGPQGGQAAVRIDVLTKEITEGRYPTCWSD